MMGPHINSRPALWLYLVAILASASLPWPSMARGVERPLAAPEDASLNLGPYNVTALEGGIGIVRPLAAGSEVSAAATPWSMSGWIRWTRRQSGDVVVAVVGDSAAAGGGRGIFLANGELRASIAPGVTLRSSAQLQPDRWTAVALTYDGAVARLYVDGALRIARHASTTVVKPRIELAPTGIPAPTSTPSSTSTGGHFGGSLALFTFTPFAQSAAQIQSLARAKPDFSLLAFNVLGAGWPWQEHAWRGLQEPQDSWTLPHGNTPPSLPVAIAPPPGSSAELRVTERGLRRPGVAILQHWHLASAPSVDATGEQLSQASYRERDWYPAEVPGTVLTTLIARGVYPDPDYGLNNMAIPESLSRQDYWYRSVFDTPAASRRTATSR